MSEESKIYDEDGKLIAVRHVEDHNGGKRVTTQEAWHSPVLSIEQRGQILDDRDVYPDGSEYDHKGAKLK